MRIQGYGLGRAKKGLQQTSALDHEGSGVLGASPHMSRLYLKRHPPAISQQQGAVSARQYTDGVTLPLRTTTVTLLTKTKEENVMIEES